MDKKSFFIGLGIGIVAGGIGGFVAGNQVTKKHARRDIETRCRNAYIRGKRDGNAEAEAGCIVVEAATPECIQKAIDAHFATSDDSTTEESKDSPDALKRPLEGQTEASESNKQHKTEKSASETQTGMQSTAEKPERNEVEPDATASELGSVPYHFEGNHVVFSGAAGTELYYPRSLFFDDRGVEYDMMQVRKNILAYESDVQKLRMIWYALGWGMYIPDKTVDDWETRIEEAGEEPEEKTEERRKYLETIQQYRDNPSLGPQFISREEFYDENYLEKEYYDYYAVDNVFIKNDDLNNPVDAFTMFGTNNGQELFDNRPLPEANNSDEREFDPDIVHIKNFRMNVVAEITRYHKSYAGLQDGTAYVN